MSSSANAGKTTILKWVKDLSNINSVLDIGVGSGTYFHLLNPVIGGKWEGIEVWKPYIEQFNLEKSYSVIHNIDARHFEWSDKFYDLVIAGDVLEHMTKEDSVDLINNILEHCRACIISMPVVWYPQDETEGNHYQIHIKDDWTHEEVLSTFQHIKLAAVDDIIGVYLLSKTLDIVYSDQSDLNALSINEKLNSRVKNIKQLYLTILRREADNDGLRHYVDSNISIEEIRNIFLASDEYKQL
jgi:SAM-dependent methyltransferase